MAAESNIPLSKILQEDTLRRVADKIVSGEIEKVLIIYRVKSTKRINWDTTMDSYPEVLGMMDICQDEVYSEIAMDTGSPDEDEKEKL